MTFDSSKLSNVKSYDGKLQVQTINGEELLITTIGKVSHQLPLQNVSFPLVYLLIYFLLVNSLTITVKYLFLQLVVWCRIKNRR